jgi:hypothetical protein
MDRKSLAYWEKKSADAGEPDVMDGALNRMRLREIPVAADDADRALGLPAGSTLFFNHSGHVPAQAVLDEIERNNPGRWRSPDNGRLACRPTGLSEEKP